MGGFDDDATRVVLASRESFGIRVRLLWAAETDTASVLVQDDCSGDEFELVVERDVSPLDVYEHPYAHAARRGLDYRADRLPSAA